MESLIYMYIHIHIHIYPTTSRTPPREEIVYGHVYIYTNSSINFDDPNHTLPKNFNKSMDLLVIDKTNSDNPTMLAYQAHRIAAIYRPQIIDILLDYTDNYTDCEWVRNAGDLMEEWIGHSWFSRRKRAQDIDFDSKEAGKSRLYFVKKALFALFGIEDNTD